MLAQLRFFNFTGWVSWYFPEEYFPRPLVFWQRRTEFYNFILCKARARFRFNNNGDNFTETFVGKTDDGHVPDFRVGMEEIFNLDRKDILSSRDDDVLICDPRAR